MEPLQPLRLSVGRPLTRPTLRDLGFQRRDSGGQLLCRQFLQLGQLPLPLDRFDPGHVPLGLADLRRRFEPVGGRLKPQLEQVFVKKNYVQQGIV